VAGRKKASLPATRLRLPLIYLYEIWISGGNDIKLRPRDRAVPEQS
jgi:hypothetical protein